MDYRLIYENWISDSALSAEELSELNSISGSDAEIEYRFGKELDFGTAGMRGIIGMGTNMMNVYTVKRATQGLAEYVKGLGLTAKSRGVAISFDTRRNSELFARAAAGVLAANGIRVFVYTEPHPVPMLSFAVRKLGTVAGIMITASHNPKEYNGYKVYGEDGAQMSPEATEKVVGYIRETDYFSVPCSEVPPFESGIEKGIIQKIGRKVENAYFKAVLSASLSRKIAKKQAKTLKIVYTPIHGSGYKPVMTILKKLGVTPAVVKEQAEPDENFSTVEVPNPENKEALSMGIALAEKIKADVVFGTDPDCDRLGVALRNADGEFVALTGNQVGILLTDYILLRLKEEKKLPENGVIVKSFVSTGLVVPIAASYGVEVVETPVGFKYIGEKIAGYEKDRSKVFLFGFEESCGYLRGTHARDKDAVVASMLVAEMVCYYNYRGVSLFSRLNSIYEKFGYAIEKTVSIKYGGLNAMAEMNAVVDGLKGKFVPKIDIYNVKAVRDYSTATAVTWEGEVVSIDTAKTNAVYYEMENGIFVCVRPSGTEPKLKIYYFIRANDKAGAEKAMEKLSEAFGKLLSEKK
ncbi:MAG: phospho-sugar mutase [Clostridia bacterium]|nr:phospho-sugar mutase [Clostridia bacterium]